LDIEIAESTNQNLSYEIGSLIYHLQMVESVSLAGIVSS
jgi:hypothetical protein